MQHFLYAIPYYLLRKNNHHERHFFSHSIHRKGENDFKITKCLFFPLYFSLPMKRKTLIQTSVQKLETKFPKGYETYPNIMKDKSYSQNKNSKSETGFLTSQKYFFLEGSVSPDQLWQGFVRLVLSDCKGEEKPLWNGTQQVRLQF